MHTRRAALGAAAALLATPALPAQAGFPDRPLRLIVAYPPGGVTDIVGRILAEPLGQRLGQPVIVENRAGAGGNIGAQAASAAEPDGYTLLIGTAAMYGVNPLLYAKSGVDLQRDFLPLGTINDMANVLSVNPKRLDVGSVAELVARGKQGGLIYASVGNGSSSHLCATLLQRMAGFEATHVPYRGSSPAVAALLAAEVDFLFDTTATSTQQIRAGTFRGLGRQHRDPRLGAARGADHRRGRHRRLCGLGLEHAAGASPHARAGGGAAAPGLRRGDGRGDPGEAARRLCRPAAGAAGRAGRLAGARARALDPIGPRREAFGGLMSLRRSR